MRESLSSDFEVSGSGFWMVMVHHLGMSVLDSESGAED